MNRIKVFLDGKRVRAHILHVDKNGIYIKIPKYKPPAPSGNQSLNIITKERADEIMKKESIIN
jgi:hypothetical protein